MRIQDRNFYKLHNKINYANHLLNAYEAKTKEGKHSVPCSPYFGLKDGFIINDILGQNTPLNFVIDLSDVKNYKTKYDSSFEHREFMRAFNAKYSKTGYVSYVVLYREHSYYFDYVFFKFSSYAHIEEMQFTPFIRQATFFQPTNGIKGTKLFGALRSFLASNRQIRHSRLIIQKVYLPSLSQELFILNNNIKRKKEYKLKLNLFR